jgi:hypothetical protein
MGMLSITLVIVRATIRPHFSGHVLIFKAQITVREEFIRLRRMSGNWVYSHFIILLAFKQRN